MLHALKRLHLWWLRYGEGPSLSRTVTLVGSVLAVAAFFLHRYAQQRAMGDAAPGLSDRLATTADAAGLWVAVIFGAVALLVALRSLLLLDCWPWRKLHPGAPLAAPYLAELPPEPQRDSPYRFRLADSDAELLSYVSESEYFLGEANRDLDRRARATLYQRWLALSPRSFLYLSRTDRACPVALSIVLPLTRQGYESLYGIGRPRKKVIDFDADEICRRGPFRYLLVDTFIICKRQDRVVGRPHVAGRRYGRTLLLRHLALFWKDQPRRRDVVRPLLGVPNPHPVCLIAETSKLQLIHDLHSIGFRQNGTSAIGCALYEFDYPLDHVASTEDQARANLVQALIEAIWQVRRWKIGMNSLPD